MTTYRRATSNVRTVLLAALILPGLFLSAPGDAAAQDPPASGRTQVAQAAPSDSDLLLFWEEKELYVQTATRTEKPLNQVAENMTVVTAKEIEDMNAHNLADVLNRVPGMFIDTAGRDFNGSALLSMQGSVERLVTVLLDGVVWNSLGGGNASVNNIPVRIIERIEVIKGPASSSWGSALGGVVNIITKGTGDTSRPTGAVSASYGEANSQDYNAELFGKAGAVGYYLYAGRQQTDGLAKNRDEEQNRFYAKLSLAPTRDLSLLFTTGYSDPVENSGNISGGGLSMTSRQKATVYFATGSADYRISPEWSLKATAHLYQNKFDQPVTFTAPASLTVAGLTLTANSGDLLKRSIWDEQTVGGSVKLIYAGAMQTLVLGLEASHGTLDQTGVVGSFYQPLYQLLGRETNSLTRPSIEKWALFANDTLEFGPLAVTPGVRLDHDNITGYFVSPSIGATYELAEHTVARASVARGFTSPPLSDTSGGGLFMTPNPALKREEGWSYQVGLESAVTEYLNAKATLFRHDTHNFIDESTNPPTNNGNVVRQGYELELDTVPVYNVSLRLAHSYAHVMPENASGKDNYSYMVGVKYDDRTSLMAQLTGAYVWMTQAPVYNAQYNTFIWDFNINKRIRTSDHTSLDLFATVHNLFSGNHYTNYTYPNALRWVEGGVRFRF
jgi:vitamin B12 transporter